MRIIDVETMRRLEAETIAAGTSGYRLMRRAGEGAAELIREFAGNRFRRAVVLAGGGNNGGDALVVAALLDMPVTVYATRPLTELRGEARQAARDLPDHVHVEERTELDDSDFRPGDLIVDGLLGTGFAGELRPQFRNYIEVANRSGQPVVAMDLPSGINGDTGVADSGAAVEAALTVTFGYPKRGLFHGDGPRCSGRLRLVDIGLNAVEPGVGYGEAFFAADARRELPRFAFDIHKNLRGRLLIAAGSREYSGAAVLAANAALRTGAGMVRLAMPVSPRLPLPAALIFREFPAGREGCFAAEAARELAPWLEASSAVAAGSGWGDGPGLAEVLERLLDFPGPLLLDADALNLLSRRPELRRRRGTLVITPHPGEAHRLARGFGIPESADRIEFACALAERLHAVTLLKGARTVVAAPDGRWSVNSSGCADLAAAGSGDVLSGTVGALLAMRPDAPFEMTALGAWLHGMAGELGGRGLVADDLPGLVRLAVGGIAAGSASF